MFKVGQRVKVVVPPAGHPHSRHAGRKGTVCAARDGKYLVDNQVKDIGDDGAEARQGTLDMREWFEASEIEHG